MSDRGDCKTVPATPGLLTRRGSAVDNRPFINYLHHFVRIKKKSLALMVLEWRWFEDFEEKDDWLTELMNEWRTEVFVEQPRLHRVC